MEGWMPSLFHASMDDWTKVYEPAEDTYLMLDALYKDRSQFQGRTIVAEVGPGSGVVSTYASKLLKGYQVAIDINLDAVKMTKATARANGAQVDVIQGDLLTCIHRGIDVVIFNPPYVTTPDSEVGHGIAASWAGGRDGRLVIDRLLATMSPSLAPDALLYLLLSDENRPSNVITRLSDLGFASTVLLSRTARNERLSVIRAQRS